MMELKKHMKNKMKEVILLFLVSCIPLLWLDKYQILGHDSALRPHVDFFLLNYSFHSWNPFFNTGVDTALYKGIFMVHFPELLFQSVFPFGQAQIFVFIFWFVLMTVSMYVLLAAVFSKQSEWIIRIIGSLLYSINFFILQAWFIVERTKFSLYAALPLFVLCMLLVYKKKVGPVYGGVMAGVLYFFLNGGGSPSLYGGTVLFWAVFFIFFAFIHILQFRGDGLIRSIKTILSFSVSLALLSAYWLIPAGQLFSGTYDSGVSAQGGIQAILAWEKEISKLASYTNILRMQGFPDWSGAYHQYSSVFMTDPVFIGASFLFFGTILIALAKGMFQRASLEVRFILCFCFLLLCVGIPFSAGSQPPFGFLYNAALQYIPGFAIFRSSIYKFIPVVFFSLTVLFSYSVWYLLQNISKPVFAGITSVVIVVGLLGYHWPFFTNNFFRFDPVYTTKVRIPDYVWSVSSYITEQIPQQHRVLLLPPLDTAYIGRPVDGYTWGFYGLDLLPRVMTRNTILANDAGDSTTALLYDAWRKGDAAAFRNYAALLGVTHILFREDIHIPPGNTTDIQVELQKAKRFFGNPQMYEDKWSVFSVQKNPPLFSAASQIAVTSTQTTMPAFYSVLLSLPVFQTNSQKIIASPIVSKRIYEFECLYCSKGSYSALKQGIVLPRPDHWFKEAVKGIRPAASLPNQTPEQKIDTILSLAAKIAGEASFHQQLKADRSADYQTQLRLLTKLFHTLSEKSKYFYAPRIAAYLQAQQQAFTQYSKNSEILGLFEAVDQKLQPYIFISDDVTQRFVLEILEEGNYTYVANSTAVGVLSGNRVLHEEVVTLPKGVATLEVPRQEGVLQTFGLVKDIGKTFQDNLTIVTTFDGQTKKQIDITGQSPLLLIFPQRFDTRWQVRTSDRQRAISQEYQGMVNGYANGWYIEDPSQMRQISIEYAPTRYFYLSIVISVVSLVAAIGFLLVRRSYVSVGSNNVQSTALQYRSHIHDRVIQFTAYTGAVAWICTFAVVVFRASPALQLLCSVIMYGVIVIFTVTGIVSVITGCRNYRNKGV